MNPLFLKGSACTRLHRAKSNESYEYATSVSVETALKGKYVRVLISYLFIEYIEILPGTLI